jgi:hypothetical protein
MPPDTSAARIHALHAWYEKNVMRFRCTAEVERLWFQFFKDGYTGQDLATVVRYLKAQIRDNKRNPGCLSLSSLLTPDTAGVMRFTTDLGLATANHKASGPLAPLPAGEATAATTPAPGRPPAARLPTLVIEHPTPDQIAERKAEFDRIKKALVDGTTFTPGDLDPAHADTGAPGRPLNIQR